MSARKTKAAALPPAPTVPELVRRYTEYAAAIAAADVAGSAVFRSGLEHESYTLKLDILHSIGAEVHTAEDRERRALAAEYLAQITEAARVLLQYDVKLIALRAAGRARTGADKNRTAAAAKGARTTRAEQLDKQNRAVRALLTLADEIRAEREASRT